MIWCCGFVRIGRKRNYSGIDSHVNIKQDLPLTTRKQTNKYKVLHKYMCNIKFKYLRQMSTTRAEIFTSDRGLFKVFFFHMRNSNRHYSWLVRPISIMMFYLLRAQKNVIDRSIHIFRATSLGKDMRKPK